MWKKFWTQTGDSYVITTTDDNTTGSMVLGSASAATNPGYTWLQLAGQQQMSVTGRPKPVYPYAIDEEWILIDWARNRGDNFEKEVLCRVDMWRQLQAMRQIADGHGPYEWKYYPSTSTTAVSDSSTTLTYQGAPIIWDKFSR